MVRAAIEESGCGRAEAAALVEIVEGDDVVGALVCVFADEEAHGDAHPEELRGFDAAVAALGFVDDQVAIVERLDAEEVEFEVCGGVEGGGEPVEVEVEEGGVVAVDFDPALETVFEGAAVEVAEGGGAVGDDVPVEDFRVDVGEEDASGEACEVGVAFDEGFGVEDDGAVEFFLGHFREEGPAEFGFDDIAGEAEVETDGSEVDALTEIETVPERGGAVLEFDEDHAFLAVDGEAAEFFFRAGADLGAVGAVEDVGGGDLVVAAFHEFFLDDVLEFLDADHLAAFVVDPCGDGGGEIDGWGAVHLFGQEGLADGDFDFVLVPVHDVAVAADDAAAGCGGGELGEGGIVRWRGVVLVADDDGAGEVVGVAADERAFDDAGDFGGFDGGAVVFAGAAAAGGEFVGDGVSDLGDELAVFVGEDLLFLADEHEVGEGFTDDGGDIALGEELAFALIHDWDRVEGGHGLGITGPVEARFVVRGVVAGHVFEFDVFLDEVFGDHGTGRWTGTGLGGGRERERRGEVRDRRRGRLRGRWISGIR